ncbi:MAG: PocR ligand-binding domain-containing protein [Candidatus Limivicinus sp.]
MARTDFDMKSILDIPLWEKVQDQLAKVTGTAIICIDLKGNPVTKHSCRTEFCSVIRENPVSRKRCYRCDALAGLEAVRLERPYIYLCHCGIVDVAVPVMVGDRYLGAVMFGQVRLMNKDAEKAVRLVNEISSFQAEEEAARKDLLEMYERLPEMEYERIVEIADLINSIVKYTVDRAVKSQNQAETYQWLLKMNAEEEGARTEIQELRAPVSPQQSSTRSQDPVKPSSAIYPAIAFIRDHPRENVSMKEMADLCHLSPSYFSRLFNREIGESFVNYVNRQKIELAKEQLRGTNKSVAQIAGDVGYLNVSNFIAVFKRMEGVTPSIYRQHMFK